jgi:hypothetical protein
MKKAALLIATILSGSNVLFAGELQAAENGYCKYVTEQATAERDILRAPSAIVGPTQPSAGTPPEMIFGLTGSVASNLKAPLTMKAARAACHLYFAETEAQEHIDYAVSKFEKEALANRLDMVQRGSDRLQGMISDEQKTVEAKNATRPALYYLQSARARLDMRRTSALTGVLPYVPTMSDVPLHTLVDNKLQAEEANQRAVTKLAKQSGWDVVLVGGGRRQIGQFNSSTNISELGAFGEVSLTYNFGRHSANRHWDESTSGYLDFKKSQRDDVASRATILRTQMQDTISLLRPQLAALLEHDSEIEKSLLSIEGLDTTNARTFKNQLLADQVVLRVDIGDIQFRLNWLQAYLQTNF